MSNKRMRLNEASGNESNREEKASLATLRAELEQCAVNLKVEADRLKLENALQGKQLESMRSIIERQFKDQQATAQKLEAAQAEAATLKEQLSDSLTQLRLLISGRTSDHVEMKWLRAQFNPQSNLDATA